LRRHVDNDSASQISQALENKSGICVTSNAVGAFALSSNVNGDSNNALGEGALGSNVSSFGNTAVGDLALSNSTGSVNTALGVFFRQ
jgi:hypothetical protein